MRCFKTILFALLLCPIAIAAQGWNDNTYKQIEQRVKQPEFPNQNFVITKYGAESKLSAAKNQIAINKAILACSKAGGGKVIIPSGTWNTGAITLKSNVNLVVEKGAHIIFAFDTSLYPIVKTRWEGMDCMNYQPCIYAYGEKNIAITGEGTIDGNGSVNTWWKMCGKDWFKAKEKITENQNVGRPKLFEFVENGTPIEKRNMKGLGMRPQLINLYKCEGILIENVTLLNSPFWVMHPLLSKNITVKGVKVWNNGPNGDGCDPESCEDVIIEGCNFHTGDDCIAIKSGRNADGRKWNIPSKNIIVRNCVMEDGHGGVVIGSEISGGCNNVFVENCKMDSPNLERVLRIKTNSCRGGLTENIYMRNVEVGQCREAVLRINLNYEPKEAAKRGFNPTVRNVYMENVTCQKSKYGILLNGLDDADNIYNINVKNCTFNGVQDQDIMRTGKSHDINIENTFINGSLVLLDKPFKNYSEWLVASEMKRAAYPYLLDFSTKPKWSYVMGIEQESMLDTYEKYKNPEILNYLKEYPAKMIDSEGNITGYEYKDFNLDNVRTAKFILRMNNLQPEKNVDKALKTLFKQLENQPRTKEGVWWHKAIYANQVWLDGIFMGLPYYTAYAAQNMSTKKANKYFDDAVDQIIKTDKRTYDESTGLWKHAWDETHSQFWANKDNGQSQHTWARALGWYVMAMTEVLDVLPENYARRGEVIELLNKAMKAVVKYQDKNTGVWYDVMDVNSDKNYLESTASSMFTYVLLKGVRKGYLPAEFQKAGITAYNGILKQFVRINADKTISLTKCCSVSGLGPGPGKYVQTPNYKRDGSFEYYISEPIRDNDAKGVGPFVWASLEMEQSNLPVEN
ncbi:glycoside hydrolase family 88 protein [Segatella paludivivens]|uniref:glycoside hydrolase family 88 protein n=1 Tax=Segatella paludivivens TaxID=185294 RepID=UPI00036596D7|nr:glycoside hydrolase family 88 protein [Segatella paludivivens]